MAAMMITDRNIQYDGVDKLPVSLTSSTGKRGLSGAYPCTGLYWTKTGAKPEVAFMLAHYATEFNEHYLCGPLAQRGFGVLGYGHRYRTMEERFILEPALDDLAAVNQWLKEKAGVKKIVFIGNSGGGSLMAAHQARAETKKDIIGADAYVFLNAHPGRADVLTDVLDASVIDENDPTKTDSSLDMFNPVNGPPYSEEFQMRYHAAQKERNHKITRWAKAELKRLNDNGVADRMFAVPRTLADLRYMDVTIDPSKRRPEICYYGNPRQANFDIGFVARACTIKTWLSMWSLSDSPSRFDILADSITIPTLVLQSLADMGVFPSYAHWIYDRCGSEVKELNSSRVNISSKIARRA